MFFLTVVTYDRQPILTSPRGRTFLRDAIGKTNEARPFDLFATVLLPDHWHLVMQLPPGDANYSMRVKQIKEEFTRLWLGAKLSEVSVSEAQEKKRERGVWQPRFWEHTIRDEGDLERCVDYIHWNPRKHKIAARVRDYPWSSFHRFVEAAQYDINWGGSQPKTIATPNNWGEP